MQDSSRGYGALVALCLSSCSLFPSSAPRARAGSPDGGAVDAGSGTGGAAEADANAGGGGAGRSDGGSESGAGGRGGGPPLDAGGNPVAADGGESRATYIAVVADCLEEGTGNPDACAAFASSRDGPNELWVDVKKGSRKPFDGYLRFDFDGAFQGHTVTAVQLALTVTTYAQADGAAPEIIEVEPFDRLALFTAAPAASGSAPLAASPGLVALGQRVTYDIPTTLVVANGSLYLGLVAVSADGVGFWNGAGFTPPEVVVTFRGGA